MGIGLVYWGVVILPQRGKAWTLLDASPETDSDPAAETA
jgi:hypothetical protein